MDINQPLGKEDKFSEVDKDFLALILEMIEQKKIDLYKPVSLLNEIVYAGLSEEKQGKVDLEAVNLLAKIRELKGLCDAGYQETFQVENLVSSLRLIKERLENVSGDVFVI